MLRVKHPFAVSHFHSKELLVGVVNQYLVYNLQVGFVIFLED